MPLVPVDNACQPLPNGVSTGAVSFGPNSRRLQGDFVRCLQFLNSQVTADFTGQEVIDLTIVLEPHLFDHYLD